MKQILQNLKNGETTLADVPVRQCGSAEVLIETRATLISAGTERMLVEFGKANLLNKARHQPEKVKQVIEKVQTDGLLATLESVQSKLDQPLPLGYCNVGVVREVGMQATDFQVGDRVVSNGPHAEIVCVPQNLLAKIPGNVDDANATFTVLASIGLQGIRLAQPTLGESVVVSGLGLIGLLTVQLLKAQGCRVLGIDFDTRRLEMAQQFGAETFQLGEGKDPVAAGMAFSRGRGVDAVLITAATKSSDPVSQAARMSRKRGRIVLVGVTGLELNRSEFYEKELSLQVSCSYGPGRYDPNYESGQDYPFGFVRWTMQRNFEAVLDSMAAQQLDPRPLVTHRFKFEDAVEAYEILANDKSALGIVLQYDATAWDGQGQTPSPNGFAGAAHKGASPQASGQASLPSDLSSNVHQTASEEAVGRDALGHPTNGELDVEQELNSGEVPRTGWSSTIPLQDGDAQALLNVGAANKEGICRPVVGFIGAGNYGSRVLIPAFRRSDAQLHTIVSSGGVSAAFHGRKSGFQHASTDANAAIDHKDINTIVIATRHNTHARLVVDALRAGKHVFVEKPLALTHEQLDEIQTVLDDKGDQSRSPDGPAGVAQEVASQEVASQEVASQEVASQEVASRRFSPVLTVGFNRRFAPLVVRMKELLDRVGEPKSIILTMNAGAIPANSWIQDPVEGGGRIIGEACHLVDLMRFLVGHQIVSVHARRMGRTPSVEVANDKATITLGFADGSFGTIHYFANGGKAFPKERFEIFAGDAVLQLSNFRNLKGFGVSGFRSIRHWKQDKGHADCVAAFLKAVQDGETSPIPLQELIEVSRVAIDCAQQLRDQA